MLAAAVGREKKKTQTERVETKKRDFLATERRPSMLRPPPPKSRNGGQVELPDSQGTARIGIELPFQRYVALRVRVVHSIRVRLGGAGPTGGTCSLQRALIRRAKRASDEIYARC